MVSFTDRTVVSSKILEKNTLFSLQILSKLAISTNSYLKHFSCTQTGWDQREKPNLKLSHKLSCLETFITNTSWLNKLSLAMLQKHQHCELGHNILSKYHSLTLLMWAMKINNIQHYSGAFNAQRKRANFSPAILLKQPFLIT